MLDPLQEFNGRWILEPDPTVQDGKSLATILKYECTIVPEWNLPSTLVAAIIRCGLPANVQAIAKRAEQVNERTLWLIEPCVQVMECFHQV